MAQVLQLFCLFTRVHHYCQLRMRFPLVTCFVTTYCFLGPKRVVEGYALFQDLSGQNDRPSSRRGFFHRSLAVGTLLSVPWLPPTAAIALSPEEAAVAYNTYAASYDDLDGGKASTLLGIDQARSALFSRASGKVLEIGAGTGLNLSKYDPSKLTSLTLLDISQGMLDQAQKRFREDPNFGPNWDHVSVSFIQADATSDLISTFGVGSLDTVVDSFSLCVMGNEGAAKCLQQISKVVKPGSGQVLLLENSRSSNPFLGKYQDVTAEAAASAGGKGCVYNQDVRAMIEATTGLKVVHEEAFAAGLFRSFECTVQDSRREG